MPTLPRFVLRLDRLRDDTDKVSLLMEKYASDIRLSGYQTPGFDFTIQSALLRSFTGELRGLLENEAASQDDVDIFGNSFLGFDSYQYIELSIDPGYEQLTSVRFLGNTEKTPEKQNRFAMFGMNNTRFTPTTINVISDLRTMSDNVSEFFQIPGSSEAIRCGDDSANVEGIINRARGVVGLSEVPFAGSGVNSSLSWTGFVEQYVTPKVRIVPTQGSSFTAEDVKNISARFDQSTVKTNAQKAEEEAIWASASFKTQIAETREKSFAIVNSSAEILADPSALSAKIKTLADAYDMVLDKVSLGCLLKSAAECIIPPLTCKEILRGLRVDNIADKISLAFPNQPRLVEKIQREIEKAKKDHQDEAEITDAFLDAIETVIDIEAICDLVNFLSLNFTIPTIELPDLDIIDLFGSVQIAIETAILDALIKAILDMILDLLDTLLACDNLDAFIAGAINGELPTDNAVTNDLSLLFSDPSGVLDPSKGAIASGLKARWDDFAKEADTLLQEFIKVDAEVGLDALGGAAQLRAQVDGAGGLQGIKEALDGNLGKLAAEAIFESFFQGELDITQLLTFRGGAEADALNSLLEEIGRFEISDDGQEFSLRRVSDDQTVTIFSTISRAPKGKLNISGEQLSNGVGLLLDSLAAVLTPGDMLNLLAGTSTTTTQEVVIETILVKHQELSFINKPGHVMGLFKTLGNLTGLSNTKNAAILAGQTRRTRNIPRKFCPEDDEAFALREAILSRSQPPEVVSKNIDELIEIRRIRYNEIADLVIQASSNDFTPESVIEPILCGLLPDGTRPAVVESALNSTFNTMFEPVKMAFDREIPRYSDAISAEEKLVKPVPRKIKKSGGKQPVFSGAGAGSLFGTADSFLETLRIRNPFDDPEEIPNPDWIKMVSDGMVPTKGNGEIDGDPGEDYINGETPITVSSVVKRVALSFKKGMKFEKAVTFNETAENSFEVLIQGSLPPQSPAQEFSNVPAVPPAWVIRYKETNENLSLTVAASGQVFSQQLGAIPFSENFFFTGESVSEPDLLDRAQQLGESYNGRSSRKSTFASLMMDKVKPAVKGNFDAARADAEIEFGNKYEDFLQQFLTSAGKTVANNRLLEKVPNKSLSHLAPGTTDDTKDKTETLVISLINFSADPTDEQKRCGADPHLLDLEFIKKVSKGEYDKDCVEDSNNDGVSKTRAPINSSGFVGAVLTTIRVYVIEYVLRSLFVLDEYGYRSNIIEDQLLTDYVTFRMKNDLERQGLLASGEKYYDVFLKEAVLTYDKMIASEQFAAPDKLPPVGADKIPGELKVLVREQLKSVLGKMKDIVGVPEEEEKSSIEELLAGLPEMGTYSDYEVFQQGGLETSNNQRLKELFVNSEPRFKIPFPPVDPVTKENDSSGRYVLEKYLVIPEAKNAEFNSRLVAKNLRGVVNFENWKEFISTLATTEADENIVDLFKEDIKYGYRLVYVSPAGSPNSKDQIVSRGKKCDLNGKPFVLEENVVNQTKAFFVLEKDLMPLLVDDSTSPAIPPTGFDSFFERFGITADIDGVITDPPIDALYEYRQHLVVPIAQSEVSLTEVNTLTEFADRIEDIFQQKYEKLFRGLAEEIDSRLLFDYCFFSKRLISLLAIHSSMIFNNDSMKTLFEGTKQKLKSLFDVLGNMGDYTSVTGGQILDGVPGNAAAFKSDFDSIGSPGGPKSPDAFYYHTITPILILRGLAELIDPNLSIVAKIVAAAGAGYLAPRFRKNPDGSFIDPLTPQYTPIEIIKPDGTKCIVRGGSEVPAYAASETKVFWDPIEFPLLPGLPPLRLREGGVVTIPAAKTDIFGYKTIYGLDRRPGEDQTAVVESVPEYPGDAISLPYGLVSAALLPINKFLPFFGPFCGPPTFPPGEWFLGLEPLIYQLPNYKIAAEKTDVKEELKASSGIDLSSVSRVKCADGEEPAKPQTVAPAEDGSEQEGCD